MRQSSVSERKIIAKRTHGKDMYLMAMPQRDKTIEEIKFLDVLHEYAVANGEEVEAERIRAELMRLIDSLY